jgi:hypothetical protein
MTESVTAHADISKSNFSVNPFSEPGSIFELDQAVVQLLSPRNSRDENEAEKNGSFDPLGEWYLSST